MASVDLLSRVLERFDVPTLASRLPSRFRDTYGLAVPQQYGIACRDVRRCCAIAESLGAGPFLVARIPATGWQERGELRRCTLEVGLGYAGNTQVEFLGPGRGTDFYSSVLDGAEARLHHAGIYQRGVGRIGRSSWRPVTRRLCAAVWRSGAGCPSTTVTTTPAQSSASTSRSWTSPRWAGRCPSSPPCVRGQRRYAGSAASRGRDTVTRSP